MGMLVETKRKRAAESMTLRKGKDFPTTKYLKITKENNK